MKKKILFGMVTGLLMLGVASASYATPYTYATDVRWDSGSHATPNDTNGSRYNQTSALGDLSNLDFLSLGIGGSAVFDFGVDFNAAAIVLETTYGRDTYPLEQADVYVADSSYESTFSALSTGNGLADLTDLSLFTFVGTVDNKSDSTELNLSSLGGPFRYLLVQDISEAGDNRDGFDVNAVGVAPVPEPATMLLFGTGLVGLIGFARRKRK